MLSNCFYNKKAFTYTKNAQNTLVLILQFSFLNAKKQACRLLQLETKRLENYNF